MAIRSKKNTGAYPDINNFLEFVEECVEEASDPVFGVKQRENPRRDSGLRVQRVRQGVQQQVQDEGAPEGTQW